MAAEWLDNVASEGAAVLITAMVTDAWNTARAGIARLFGQGDSKRQERIDARLNEDAIALERSEGDKRDSVRNRLLAAWQARLVDLLEEQPEVASELQSLIQKLRAELPAVQQAWIQANVATTGGITYGVQGGIQNIYNSGGPDERFQ